MKILKYVIVIIIMVLLDIYLFTGPVLNGFGLIILIILNIRNLIKKRLIKPQLSLLLLLILTEIFTINVGDFYNEKIMSETEKIYYDNLDDKNNRIKTTLYGKYVSIYKHKNYAFVHLYNFQTATFKNNEWTIDRD